MRHCCNDIRNAGHHYRLTAAPAPGPADDDTHRRWTWLRRLIRDPSQLPPETDPPAHWLAGAMPIAMPRARTCSLGARRRRSTTVDGLQPGFCAASTRLRLSAAASRSARTPPRRHAGVLRRCRVGRYCRSMLTWLHLHYLIPARHADGGGEEHGAGWRADLRPAQCYSGHAAARAALPLDHLAGAARQHR